MNPFVSRPFHINTLTRRDFMIRTLRAGGALGLAALTQVPPFARRALAEGSIGLTGRKLLFVFLRGANDALNSCIPIQDSAYGSGIRPDIFIPKDSLVDYSTAGSCEFPTNFASTFEYVKA